MSHKKYSKNNKTTRKRSVINIFLYIFLLLIYLAFPHHYLSAQNNIVKESKDTAEYTHKSIHLDEITIFGKTELYTESKNQLADINKYIEGSNSINMIKRGAYAWEPMINGMGSERSNITIDGMHIFSACTDKMDPITSYVEVTNLSSVDIASGQKGNEHGMSISGSINLVRKKSDFNMKGTSGHAFIGYESANKQKITGIALENSHKKYFTDISFTYRNAANYKAGGNLEIPFSQFTKYNASAIGGYKLTDHHIIEGSIIYDHAVDVGYPALPMDVATAKAGIFSAQYNYFPKDNPFIHEWKTKIYYNSITHIMDDTKRPDVPVRMDMPGWSKTGGFYTQVHLKRAKHRINAKLSGYQNASLAEMTMYPNQGDEKDMFMLTWPDVLSSQTQLYLRDQIHLTSSVQLDFSGSLAYQHAKIRDESGFENLKIFHPDINSSNNRLLKSLNANVLYDFSNIELSFGTGYGERAPDVSEGYGFYLFNSFDKYDYIGSPSLPNETSLESNLAISYQKNGHSLKLKGDYFHIRNHIIGKPIDGINSMTIGAKGVKMYTALDFANLFSTSLEGKVSLKEYLKWKSSLSYRIGRDNEKHNLPLIQPFSYNSELEFSKNQYTMHLAVEGAAKHKAISTYYGESPVNDYLLLNLSLRKAFNLQGYSKQLYINVGVDNLLDRRYTTFADWNRIPQMGRNIFTNLMFTF